MEEMITQDYEFDTKSLMYGKFLQECHESYPEVEIREAASFYPFKAGVTYLTVTVPAHVATVLKLRFGLHLRTRPAKDPAKDLLEELLKKEKQQRVYDYWKKNHEWDKWKRDQDAIKEDYRKIVGDWDKIREDWEKIKTDKYDF